MLEKCTSSLESWHRRPTGRMLDVATGMVESAECQRFDLDFKFRYFDPEIGHPS